VDEKVILPKFIQNMEVGGYKFDQLDRYLKIKHHLWSYFFVNKMLECENIS
jgi:hypothetical protein